LGRARLLVIILGDQPIFGWLRREPDVSTTISDSSEPKKRNQSARMRDSGTTDADPGEEGIETEAYG